MKDLTLSVSLNPEDRKSYRDIYRKGKRRIESHMRELVRRKRTWENDPHTAGRPYTGPKGISTGGVVMSVTSALRTTCCHALVAKDAGIVLGGKLLGVESITQQLISQAEANVASAKRSSAKDLARANLNHVLSRVESLQGIADTVGVRKATEGQCGATGEGEEAENCTVCLEAYDWPLCLSLILTLILTLTLIGCLEAYEWPVVTGCCHIFCRECVNDVMSSKSASRGLCPICRARIKPAELMEMAPAGGNTEAAAKADAGSKAATLLNDT